MKKLKLLFLSFIMLFFTSCGTTTEDSRRIDPNRGFDMWEYMTAVIDVEAKYDIYENGVRVDYYSETHRLFNNKYERQSSSGLTTLFANSSNILMKEPEQDITIERYLHLGDKGVFHAPSIDLCSLEQFYYNYERRGIVFHNVLKVNCTSKSGVNQQYFYGYNEGIVVISEHDGVNEKEWIKVDESRL